MRPPFMLSALLYIVPTLVFAQEPAQQKACPADSTDPFSYQARMPGGPLKGHCINTNHYRSVHGLTDAELKEFGIQRRPGVVVVANFQHDFNGQNPKFWVAQIPVDSLRSAIFQLTNLNSTFNVFHGQIRYQMKPNSEPVTLVLQKKNPAERERIELRDSSGNPQDIVLSLFGARDVDHDFDSFRPTAGMNSIGLSEYANSYAIQSLYNGSQWVIDDKDQSIQYALNISPSQMAAMMGEEIKIGTEHDMTEMYDVVGNNCLDFSFGLLKAVLPKDVVAKSGDTAISQTADPSDSLLMLGVIAKQDKPLNVEFPHGIEKIVAEKK